LAWWWGHLSSECLHDPLAGLFVDQKWMDIGSVLFGATTLRHYGYNVGVANLHERPVARDSEGYYTHSKRGPAATVPLPRLRPRTALKSFTRGPAPARGRAAPKPTR